MKRLFGAVAVLLGSVGGAFADDPAPSFNWSGPYFGALAGGAFGTGNEYWITPPDYRYSATVGGPIGAVVVGYTAVRGQKVFGVELDVWGGNITGNTGPQLGPCSAPCYYDIYTANWGGHVRATAGFVNGRFAGFLAAGVAIASWDYSAYLFPSDDLIVTEDVVHVGASVGVILEAALSENASFRAEYLFDHYFLRPYFDIVTMEYNVHTIRFGLILRK